MVGKTHHVSERRRFGQGAAHIKGILGFIAVLSPKNPLTTPPFIP
jgi:hypothetical protein